MNFFAAVGPDGVSDIPDISEDDDGRRNNRVIDVTVLRKNCVDTGEMVYRFISGHKFSQGGELLGDHVVRTQVSSRVFLLLHVPSKRNGIIKEILYNNP